MEELDGKLPQRGPLALGREGEVADRPNGHRMTVKKVWLGTM